MTKLEKPRITVGKGPTRVCKVLCLVLILIVTVIVLLMRDAEVSTSVRVQPIVSGATEALAKNVSYTPAQQAVAVNPLSDISPT